VGRSLFTRSGVIISTAVHGGAVVLAVLLSGANPFDSVATEAIAVDIISASEAPPVPDPWAIPANESIEPPKSQFDVAALTPPPLPMPTTPPEPKPDAKAAADQSGGRAPSEPSRAAARAKVQDGSKAPPPPQSAPPQGPPPQVAGAATDSGKGGNDAPKETNVANMFGMPLALPDGRLGGAFDSAASETAKIERSSIDAFRGHIKSCASLPAGISPSDRISLVVRIALKPDGTLAGQPTLIEASASPKGPALLQSLFAGLAKCQPFNMLPADKYQEWRSLDIRFTPQDLGQG